MKPRLKSEVFQYLPVGRILSGNYLQKFMQLFNICTKKIIEKDGVKRIKWYKIGVMKITDNENKYMMLFQQPNTDFYIFDQDPTLPVIQVEN